MFIVCCKTLRLLFKISVLISFKISVGVGFGLVSFSVTFDFLFRRSQLKSITTYTYMFLHYFDQRHSMLITLTEKWDLFAVEQ